ncbi:hypothetical protein [Puia sp.]|jgi:hypothetical protein|uniref:hypothetical protein n=1 Tax=Puia sp. TaxID=2045100 RepID=UPI002F417371
MTISLPKILLFPTLLLCRISTFAQVFSNDAAVREANFVTKVVQLDEFIHRFNNDTISEIRQYYLSHNRPWDKSREQLIRSLFNYTTQRWDTLQMDRFIRRVTNPEQPDYLGFMRDQWYAEATCQFLYRAEIVKATLVLKLQLNPDGSAQWVIAAVKPGFPLAAPKKQRVKDGSPLITTISAVVPRRRFIQPAANETYFAELGRDFADKHRLADLFDRSFFERRYSGAFYQALLRNRIRFVTVKRLRYHYLQVHDWVFTVENFQRQTRNSGWLIASIRPVNTEQRSDYLKKLLQE